MPLEIIDEKDIKNKNPFLSAEEKKRKIEEVKIGDLIIPSFDKGSTSLDKYARRRNAKSRNRVQVTPGMSAETIKYHKSLVQVIPDTIIEDTEINISSLSDDIMMIREFCGALSILKCGIATKYDYNLFELILDKRIEIYKETGFLIPIKMMVDKAIIDGVKKVNEETM